MTETKFEPGPDIELEREGERVVPSLTCISFDSCCCGVEGSVHSRLFAAQTILKTASRWFVNLIFMPLRTKREACIYNAMFVYI